MGSVIGFKLEVVIELIEGLNVVVMSLIDIKELLCRNLIVVFFLEIGLK